MTAGKTPCQVNGFMGEDGAGRIEGLDWNVRDQLAFQPKGEDCILDASLAMNFPYDGRGQVDGLFGDRGAV